MKGEWELKGHHHQLIKNTDQHQHWLCGLCLLTGGNRYFLFSNPFYPRKKRYDRSDHPSAALTFTTAVAPVVFYDRHPAPNIHTTPADVTQHHSEKIRRGDWHRHQNFGLPKDQKEPGLGKEKNNSVGSEWKKKKKGKFIKTPRKTQGHEEQNHHQQHPKQKVFLFRICLHGTNTSEKWLNIVLISNLWPRGHFQPANLSHLARKERLIIIRVILEFETRVLCFMDDSNCAGSHLTKEKYPYERWWFSAEGF